VEEEPLPPFQYEALRGETENPWVEVEDLPVLPEWDDDASDEVAAGDADDDAPPSSAGPSG
jgi:hypothetical protein